MSEATNEPTSSTTPPSPSREQKPAKGKWRRRVRRTLITLVLIVLALRIALFFAIRPVLHKVAAAYNLDISFGRQEMTLQAADVGFWYIKVTPKSGGAPIFAVDYIRGRISPWELLKGHLYVYRAEADGVDLTLERTKDGRLPALEQIMASHSATPAAAPTTQPEKPLDFTSPLQVEAFRLQHVRAHIRDETVEPPLEALLAMDVRASYLGQIDRPVQFEADIWSDPALDLVRVIGQATDNGQNLDATLAVLVRGLHLKPLAGYLATVGLRPYQDDLGLKMSATLKTEPSAESKEGVKATLAIDRIDVTSESQPVASVQAVNVEASDVEPKLAKISSIVVNGVRAHAARSSDGIIRVAGLELVGGATPRPPSPPSQSPFQVSVRDVAIRDVQAELHDASVSPPTDLKFVLSEAGSKSEGIDPSNPESIVPINAQIALPGLVRSITLNGKLKPFAADKTIDATFTAEGIKPDAAHGYLAPLGVESLLKDARGEGKLSAIIHPQTIDAQISDLKLTDGEDLITMPKVQITSLGTDAATGRTHIAAIELTGPAIDVTRDSAGRFTTAGFRYDPSAAAPPKPTSQPAAVASAVPATKPSLADSLPKIQIDRLNWSGVRLHLRDEQTQPPTTVAIDDAGIEGSDLVLDLTSNTAAKPGTLKLHMSSPTLAKQLSLETTLQPSSKTLSAQFAVRGAGLNLKPLAPYLVPLGIEPTLHDATLQIDGNVNLTSETDRVVASLGLSSTKLTEGSTTLGGLDQLRVDELALANDGTISVKSVQLKHPQIDVSRDEHGVLSALGVRLVPTTRPAASTTAPPTVATTAPAQQAAPTVAMLDELRVEDAAVNWNDRVPTTPVALHAHANLLASKLVVGQKAQPASFRATLAVDDLLKELVAAGRIDTSPGALSAIASIDGKGIGGQAIAPYLPPGMELATQDGRFKAEIQADLANPPQGGNAAKLIVQHLNWRDGEVPTPLFAFDAFTLDAPRIDPAANVITINDVSLAGLTTHAELAKDGSTQALGLVIRPQKQPPVAKETLVTNNAQLAAATAAPAGETDVSKLVTEERRPLPLITLKNLDLSIRSAKVQNLAMPDAAPLELQDVRLHNPQPIVLGGPDAANEPAVMIDLTGKVAPVVGSFDVTLAATPFATSPAGTIALSAAGIRGAGVTELIPTLKKQLNGDGLTDGRLSAQLTTQIKFDRRGPRDFDLSRGFQADLLIDKMQFRDGENGPVFAGLESIRADQVRVEPKNGSVFAKLIELSNPKLTAVRDTDGIHALGFIIPLKSESTTQPTTAPESAPPEPEPTIATPLATAAPTTKPTGEIRVDRLTLTGLDVRVEDRTVTPPTIVPLNNLDLEVRDFTTLALVEPRMMRFALTMSADKVPLPAPVKQGGGIVGAFGAVGSHEKEPTTRGTENRELLSQISAVGSIGLYPKLTGYVKGSMNGIELAGFEGEAKQGGVDLTGGVFDGTFDVRFADNGDIVTKSKLVFTDLKVDEPAGGPIAKGLKFPAPLGAVVGALQDVSGAITVPVNMTLQQGQLTGGEVMGAAAGAVAPIVATAVTNAPLKAVAGAGDIIGVGALLGKDKKKQPREPIVIQFAAGSVELDPASKQRISALIEEAQRDDKMQLTIRHELGGQDVPILAARANPSPQDCQALASQLRTRKAELARQRDELSSQVEAQLASYSSNASNSSVTQLRDLDRESAQVETSLDQLYDLLRPGADRQADRRTRKAALDLGQARVDAINKLFTDAKLTNANDRIKAIAPRPEVATADAGRVTITITGAKK